MTEPDRFDRAGTSDGVLRAVRLAAARWEDPS
jgi:hypothetical protein